MPGTEQTSAATKLAVAKGRWAEARPIALPAAESEILTFSLESSGAPISAQLIRRNPEGRTVAWAGIHTGPLLRETIRVQLADLAPGVDSAPSPEDSLVLRFKALEGAAQVLLSGIQFAAKEVPMPARKPGAIGPEGLRWPRDGGNAESGDSILIFGTFDVENYGDLLFPLIAERRLAQSGLSVTPVSPTDVATPFEDAPRPLSIEAVAQRNPPGKGVLIGGGNIVHLRPTALPDYQSSDLGQIAYPALWIGATALAAAYDLPIAWNAPGVPFAESSWPAKDVFYAAAAAADYVSVRDEDSRERLDLDAEAIAVTPDTAIEISRVWPLSTIEPLTRNALESRGFAPDSAYVAVHVKERSIDGPLEELARQLDDFSAETGKPIALLAIGACHGDDDVARQLSDAMSQPTILFDRVGSLREIAAIIACADLIVCSSLHAYITSFSYGRPGILVAPPMNQKFKGFTRLVEREDDLVFDWTAALATARDRLVEAPVRTDLVSGEIARRLDAHWSAVVAALSDPESGRSRRADFLRAAMAVNLRRSGWDAVLPALVAPE